MTFVLFLFTVATLYIRPGELIPEFEGLPLYAGLLALCVIGAHRSILDQFTWSSLRRNPITLCLVGLVGAAAVSHASHAHLSMALAAAEELAKSLILYLVLMAVVNTPRKFHTLLFTVAISGIVMITLSVLDYYDIIDIPPLVHIVDDVVVVEHTECARLLRHHRHPTAGAHCRYDRDADVGRAVIGAASVRDGAVQ